MDNAVAHLHGGLDPATIQSDTTVLLSTHPEESSALALGHGHFAAHGHYRSRLENLICFQVPLDDMVVGNFVQNLAVPRIAKLAYYATIVAVRFGLDPDTYGIPMVTSTLDFVGAFTLILAIVAVGVA